MKKVLLPSLIALFMVFSSPLIIHAEDYIAREFDTSKNH